MHITQWGEYGVLITLLLARSGLGKSMSAAEIALSQGIALDYVHQILQRLRTGGFIESVRGPSGGYRMVKQSHEVTLYDVIVASEGGTFDIICETKPLNESRCSPNATCVLRPVWKELQNEINKFLRSYTIGDLMKTGEGLDGLVNLKRESDHETPAKLI